MTLKEFKKHHETYTKKFMLYGKTFDLNFKMYMIMQGLSEEEFDKLILDI